MAVADKVQVEDLIFEVTRKCNMECDHCLRGEATNRNLVHRHIDKVLDDIKEVYSVTFTGGEPTLAISTIEYIVDGIIKRDIPVHSFYIVTNGLIYSERLVNKLIEFFAYIYKDENPNYIDHTNNCGLAVSLDIFHDKIPKENLLKYKALNFYRRDKEQMNPSFVINEGRGTNIALARPKIDDDKWPSFISIDGVIHVEQLYVSATGHILTDCDLSYKRQNKFSLGQLDWATLSQILDRYVKEERLSDEAK